MWPTRRTWFSGCSRSCRRPCFVYDYRGYGRSRGKPTERGCVADGMAAQRWLAEREGVDTEDIVLMGRSIGGGVSVAAAAEQGARALVLEATFSRMTDAAANLYPWLPVRLVMSNRYNSIKRMQKYQRAVIPEPRCGRRSRSDQAGPQAVRFVAQRRQAVLRNRLRPAQRHAAPRPITRH